jgi:hypothetical protein
MAGLPLRALTVDLEDGFQIVLCFPSVPVSDFVFAFFAPSRPLLVLQSRPLTAVWLSRSPVALWSRWVKVLLDASERLRSLECEPPASKILLSPARFY